MRAEQNDAERKQGRPEAREILLPRKRSHGPVTFGVRLKAWPQTLQSR